MNTADVIRLLRENGIEINLDPDSTRLKYRGPCGALTPFIRATLIEYMPAIVDLYNERAAIMEYDGGLSASQASARAVAALRGEQ